ncbi:MAG: hypothetical protein HRU19_26365 [Pseudobacteriovorax sp.]|nr:hypothetical protein [Pseudobacteriovorax sp.]
MNWNPEADIPDQFFEIPKVVYRDDPWYRGENSSQIRQLFGSDHDFFVEGKAVLMTQDNTRLAGFWHPQQRLEGKAAAYFGFWETDGNLDSNCDLFQQLKSWARSLGASTLIGPIDFSTYYRNRTRLTGGRPFLGEPYNPGYYASVLSSLGFRIALYYTTAIPKPWWLYRPLLLRKFGAYAIPDSFRVEPITVESFERNFNEFYRLTDGIFSENPGYRAITFDKFKATYFSYRHLLCSESSQFVFDGDRLVAFSLCMPDFLPLVYRGTPLQDIRFETHFSLLSRPILLAKTFGVDKDYRKHGLYNAMMHHSILGAKRLKYKDMFGCLVRQGNYSNSRVKLKYPIRKYALFGIDL